PACTMPTVVVWAMAATASKPAAAMTSTWPESMAWRELARGPSCWAITAGSATFGDPQRRGRVVVILRHHAVGRAGGRDHGRGPLPAVALQRGHERVHERRVELAPRPFAKLRNGLVHRPGAPVGAGGCHRVERIGHRDDPCELGEL